MEWVNFGGGHHITEEDYQIEELIELIKDFSARYEVQVYLEPGEAIAIHTGILFAEVLDIVHNGMPSRFLIPLLLAICQIRWKCPIVPIYGGWFTQ